MSETTYTTFVSTIVEKDGKVLLVQEGKNNHGQRGKWNLPAGHAELGESLPSAAAREVKEETGYDVKIDGLAAVHKYDIGSTVNTVFFFTGSLANDTQSDYEDSMMAVKWVSAEEVSALDLRFDDITRVLRKLKKDGAYLIGIFMEKEGE
ncbi:MAG: NUDIX domain-containing protein [Candidatus Nomurabacteria bacterium]|jgi:8-oxo-dGTP pyrophosphatase MutT (NUDIX family)|nr:NUDIX domain-containing protein [Candidatus Nomurabacteria bacterium]